MKRREKLRMRQRIRYSDDGAVDAVGEKNDKAKRSSGFIL